MNLSIVTDTTKPIKQHENKLNSRGIMYYSRMRYLKSREGNKKSNKLSFQNKERIAFESLNQENTLIYTEKAMLSAKQKRSVNLDSYTLIDKNKVCSPSKLLPPNELLSRSQAFRLACLKNLESSPIKKIRKLDSLSRKEDPRITNHRNEILSRIRRHTESLLQINRREVMNENIDDKRRIENKVTAILDIDGEQLEHTKNSSVTNEYRNTIVGIISTLTDRVKTKYPKSETNNDGLEIDNNLIHNLGYNGNSHKIDSMRNEIKHINEEDDFDTYPEIFSFLGDWKNVI